MKKLWTLLLTLVFAVGLISPMTITTTYAASGIAMTVNGTEYADHGTGWSAAVKKASGGTDVTVKLFADWIADAKNGFVCPDGGTKDGALYVGESKGKFTLDLNGHSLDRNASQEVYVSSVIYVEDCNFTVDDTSKEKDGKITGGYINAGGGIYAKNAVLTLNGGNISGNKAKLGSGVFLLESKFTMNGGSITDNYAINNGGGIYVNCEDFTMNGGVIARNYAALGGGAVYMKGDGTTYKFNMYGGVIEENYAAADGGAIYLNNGYLYVDGSEITGNTANEEGGAIYANSGYLNVDGGEITGNTAEYGGGIYWYSLDAGYFTGGKIYGNTATEKGGGMYVKRHSNTYYGGDIQIFGNTNGNLYLDNPDVWGENISQIFNACGQNGSPNKPLTDGAYIGIHVSDINKQLTGYSSSFNEGDFEYFHPDISSYFIRSVYKPNGEGNDHRLYFNEWGHEDARYPRVKSVSVKDSNLLTDAVLDYDTQTITLTAHNTRRNFFERAVLADLIECTYDKDIYYLYQMDYMRDLRELQKCKIMSDNGTYVICKVQVVPEGGKWADEQESVDNPYKMTVATGASFKGFNDFDEGWTYAVSQSSPVAITLFADWNATDGEFDYSEGTKGGALYIDKKDITIDLNGNTINRGLTTADSDGHVFWLVGGAKLTINDTSDACSGKITGAYGSGNGGAFYVDYGKLYINGGEISGNQAENGAAIYSTNEDDSFIYINGGKFTDNTATGNGGAIFMEEGFLYMDGGEISGNYATGNGGGIYWNSENKLCLTGGKITGNKAKEGAGVYGTDWGKMYVGGTIFIKDNIMIGTADQNNFILSDTDVYLNNAAEQPEIPNKPLTDGAYIGICGAKADTLISGPDSRFNVDSAKYFKADRSMYWVYGWYDASDGDNTYKLYYNFDSSGSELPRIKSVESKSDLVQASLNSDSYAITLTADMNVKKLGTLERAKLSELINVTFSKSGVQIMNFDADCDYTVPQKIMVIDGENRYSVYTVTVEWICSEHTDADNDGVCDDCKEYVFSNTTIVDYNSQTKEATVFAPVAGRYTIIFASYDDKSLVNMEMFECDLQKGFNDVQQKVDDWGLETGDKIMLWRDTTTCAPLCQSYTVK